MPNINPDTLLLIEDLFNRKKWKIDDHGTSMNLFQRFCERLKLLTVPQQHFIIDLTNNFLKIELSEYLEKFYESLMCVSDELFHRKEKIFVYPLIKPYIEYETNKKSGESIGVLKIPQRKTKSANFLHYMFECDDWRWLSTKFINHTSIGKLRGEFNNGDSVLFLIDDYIGSGRTAIETCEEYLSESYGGKKILPENIKVISIAAQADGIKNVKNTLGIDVISNIILPKGISDNYEKDVLQKKLDLMIEIEEAIGGIPADYLFGWEKTEGLITFMNKTPNNTFPVYWHETTAKVAPFPRYKVYGN